MYDVSEAIDYIEYNKIEGCLVECGVYKGQVEISWINRLIQHQSLSREIWLYDTFAGLSEPGDNDFTNIFSEQGFNSPQNLKKFWEDSKRGDFVDFCFSPLDEVKSNIENLGYPNEKIKYIVGDVLDTLLIANNLPEKIAVLRLDTDWYESSKIELEKLYPKLVSGGLIIFDDYFYWEGQKKAVDEYLSEHDIKLDIHQLNVRKIGAAIKP